MTKQEEFLLKKTTIFAETYEVYLKEALENLRLLSDKTLPPI